MKFKNIIYFLILFPSFLLAQHTIKVTFSPAKDFKWAVLYKNSPNKNLYIAQGKIENGNIVFNLDENATKGIYKIVYAVPQNEYNFDIIYNGEENIELTFDLSKGPVFQKSSENILLNNYLNELASIGKELESNYVKESIDTLVITNVYKKQTEIYTLFDKKSKGKIVNHIVNANKPYVPKHYETPVVYINNLTKNYFLNINYNDTILQSSNLLLEKSLAYILGVQSKEVSKLDAYNHNIDVIIEKIKDTDIVYQKVFLSRLWQKLVNFNLINSANYLAEKYLISIANLNNDEALVIKLVQFKNLSIGNIAPEISWEIEENNIIKTKRLSEIDVAENYILVFWSSGCSHCLEQFPNLQEFAQSLESNIYKVIAISLEENSDLWKKEILKYPEFIHGIKLNKWASVTVRTYAITSTPTYFVLDKDKRFIAKPKNLEGLKVFIESQK